MWPAAILHQLCSRLISLSQRKRRKAEQTLAVEKPMKTQSTLASCHASRMQSQLTQPPIHLRTFLIPRFSSFPTPTLEELETWWQAREGEKEKPGQQPPSCPRKHPAWRRQSWERREYLNSVQFRGRGPNTLNFWTQNAFPT